MRIQPKNVSDLLEIKIKGGDYNLMMGDVKKRFPARLKLYHQQIPVQTRFTARLKSQQKCTKGDSRDALIGASVRRLY